MRLKREQGIRCKIMVVLLLQLKRKFIIADNRAYSPETWLQAPTANVATILIDARHGVIEQTKKDMLL
jgi:sulfate adenylyltransferase subunit 1